MGERRRRLAFWLLARLFIFALGVAAGYYARDRQQHKKIQEAVERVRAELQDVGRAGQEVIERGRRAGEGVRAGARAAAESTRAAVEEIVGDSEGKR